MYSLLILDVVGRSLDLPQSKVHYLLLGLDRSGVGECVEEMGGGEGMET